MLPDCRVDTVELDPVVARLAREHFGFEERPGTSTLHTMDAAEYLRQSPDGAGGGHSRFQFVLCTLRRLATSCLPHCTQRRPPTRTARRERFRP